MKKTKLLIIALLAGMLLPLLGRARNSAREVICLNHFRQLGAGMLAYAGEFEGLIPWDGYGEGDRPERNVGRWDEPGVWFNAMPRYAGTKGWYDLLKSGAPLPRAGDDSIFVCPEAGEPASDNAEDVIEDGYYKLWGLDPSGTPVQQKTYWTGAFNTRLDDGVEDRNVNYRVIYRMSKNRRPSITVVLLEKVMQGSEYERPNANVPFNQPSVGQQQSGAGNMTARHHGGGHFLFLDGHVAWWSRADVKKAPYASIDNYDQTDKILFSGGGMTRR